MANRKRKNSKAGAFGNPKPRRADAPQSGRDAALTSSRYYIERAIARTEHGDLYGALSDAERAVDLNPKDGDAYLTRGRGNAGIGRHEQAIVDFTQAPDYPDNSYFPRPMFLFFCYWDRADSKVALGNQAGAIADYDSAIKWNPNIPEVYHNRGHCKAELGNHAGAIADYDSAIKLNINIPEVYHNRGHCKAELGNHAGAIADYDHAIKLNQTDAAAYLNRGISKAELGDHAGAIADYDHAIKLNAKYAEAHYGRGQAKFCWGTTLAPSLITTAPLPLALTIIRIWSQLLGTTQALARFTSETARMRLLTSGASLTLLPTTRTAITNGAIAGSTAVIGTMRLPIAPRPCLLTRTFQSIAIPS